MNYAIFRSEPIYTTNDLAQIGTHNKRDKKAYNSNPNIKLEKTKDNFDLVPLNEKYVKGFYELTKEYKQEHEERMKTEREDRKRSYKQMVDNSKNVVADEMIFTASHNFFNNMKKDDIKKWADTCMEFVYKDLGYTKDQILHATVHMDEETPHIHCVAVPLIKKYDKRTNTERLTISKKQYIKDKNHLSELQDKYCKRLNEAGFKLERGIKNNDTEHIKIKEFKKLTRNINNQVKNREEKLDKAILKLEENMKSNKSIIFDKDSVKIKKETFDSINNVIKESKKISELKEEINDVYESISNYIENYSEVFKENNSLNSEVNHLQYVNDYYENEINNLEETIDYLRGGIEGVANFIDGLLFDGYIPKHKEEEYYREFYEFMNGKHKKNKSKDNLTF